MYLCLLSRCCDAYVIWYVSFSVTVCYSPQISVLELRLRCLSVAQSIGHVRSDGVEFTTVVWPGDTVSGPPDRGRRTLRVVTAVAEPFVMEQRAINNSCTTSVTCLRVNTKDKEMLDDIFKDFNNGVRNDSHHPYNVRYVANQEVFRQKQSIL